VPDYSAVFLPGLTMTSTAAGTITGGDPVEVAGSGTVQKATLSGTNGTASQKCIGVASHDAISGARVTIIVDRVVHEGTADGAINPGDQLVASAVAGKQVKTLPPLGGAPGQDDGNKARALIGIALTGAADNGTVRWMQR
jgi:hypothetical protein